MTRYCCVPYCDVKRVKGSGVSFHEFPCKLDLRLKWINAFPQRQFRLGEHSLMCCKHFTEDDYYFSMNGIGRRRLKPYAVPSIFPVPRGTYKARSTGETAVVKIVMPNSNQGNPEKISCRNVDEIQTGSPQNYDEIEDIESCIDIENIINSDDDEMEKVNSTDIALEITSYPNEDDVEGEDTIHSDYDGIEKRSLPDNETENLIQTYNCGKTKIEDALSVNSDDFLNTQRDGNTLSVENSKMDQIFLKVTQLQRELWNKDRELNIVRSRLMNMQRPYFSLSRLEKDAQAKKPGAMFLLDLVKNYGRKRPEWSQQFLDECIMFLHESPEGFRHFNNRLLKLPDEETILHHLQLQKDQNVLHDDDNSNEN